MLEDRLDEVFQALSDQTRRSMLRRLADGEKTVTELARPYFMSLAAVSKHIHVLEKASLLEQVVSGRKRICRLNAQAMAEADEWLHFYERYWQDQQRALESGPT
jgi:DNA-binding transcriptional ArsR family regulator